MTVKLAAEICGELCRALRTIQRGQAKHVGTPLMSLRCSLLRWTDTVRQSTSSTAHDVAPTAKQELREWEVPKWGRRLGKWVKYNQITKYNPTLSGTHVQVRPVDGFTRIMAQTTRTRATMCFWGFVNMAHHLGGVNKRFQAKLAKSNNVYIIKTTASISTKFCRVIKTAKCHSWVLPTQASQIQDGGRPP